MHDSIVSYSILIILISRSDQNEAFLYNIKTF